MMMLVNGACGSDDGEEEDDDDFDGDGDENDGDEEGGEDLSDDFRSSLRNVADVDLGKLASKKAMI